MCPEKFTALSQTKKKRELECAGNGDENHETTVLAFCHVLIECLEGRYYYIVRKMIPDIGGIKDIMIFHKI